MRTRTLLAFALAATVLSPTSFAAKGDKQGKTPRVKVERDASKGPRPGAGASTSFGGGGQREVSPRVAGLLDQIMMLQMGNRGSKQAHLFLEDAARGWNPGNAQGRLYGVRGEHRKFAGPKNDGSVIVMFGDKSGVYIHPDGFVTPMGDDISHEVGAWQEMK